MIDSDCNLYDYKSSSSLNKEYVKWQLSIYAYLFELTNPSLKAGQLIVVHIKNNEFIPVELERIDAETIKSLLDAEAKGERFISDILQEEEEMPLTEQSLELFVNPFSITSIESNAKQIHELVKTAMGKYDVSNYNDANIDVAKKDKAMLNKASKTLNAKRLELEREYMKPFNDFKGIIAETCTLINTAVNNIDEVIKKDENAKKETKYNLIKGIWEKTEFTLVSFEKVFNEKWLNKTMSITAVQSEMDAIINKINDDLAMIERLPEDSDTIKPFYLENLNIKQALDLFDRLEATRLKMKEAEEKAKQKEAEILDANSFDVDTEEVETEKVSILTETVPESIDVFESPEWTTKMYQITTTPEQEIALLKYLLENNITFITSL
jgi:CRISPR/Cas system-associated exonuclease Cas4 (RecB family)